MKATLLILALVSTMGAVGCQVTASSRPQGDEAVGAGDATGEIPAGTFKMYTAPDASPNPFCDRYLRLTVGGSQAKLEFALDGSCEIFVDPDPRTYNNLTATPDGCGSVVYTAVGDGGSKVTITDHRRRTCENVVPAAVIVEETRNGNQATYYSATAGELDAPAVEIPAGTYKMYPQANVTPNPGCDRFLRLTLDGGSAKAESALEGVCTVVVVPDPRTYSNFTATPDGCGTIVYVGTGEGGSKATITDHRRRTCENVIPAAVILEETRNGTTSKFFSYIDLGL